MIYDIIICSIKWACHAQHQLTQPGDDQQRRQGGEIEKGYGEEHLF